MNALFCRTQHREQENYFSSLFLAKAYFIRPKNCVPHFKTSFAKSRIKNTILKFCTNKTVLVETKDEELFSESGWGLLQKLLKCLKIFPQKSLRGAKKIYRSLERSLITFQEANYSYLKKQHLSSFTSFLFVAKLFSQFNNFQIFRLAGLLINWI